MAKAVKTVQHSEFQLDEAMRKAMLEISLKVKGSGFVPVDELRAEFGERPVTVFGAIAYRDYRIVREVRRQIGPNEAVVGYEWADRRFSSSEAKKVPEDAQWMLDPMLTGKIGVKYADYQSAKFVCRWTNHVLAGMPVIGSDKQRVFERVNGDVLIPGYCVRAMLKKTLPLAGKTQSLGDYIRSAAVRVEAAVTPKLVPVVDERSHQGLGVTEHESLPPGTEFALELWFPSSEISLEQLIEVIGLAGRVVRLSPARSAGYGDFEIVSVNGESLTS